MKKYINVLSKIFLKNCFSFLLLWKCIEPLETHKCNPVITKMGSGTNSNKRKVFISSRGRGKLVHYPFISTKFSWKEGYNLYKYSRNLNISQMILWMCYMKNTFSKCNQWLALIQAIFHFGDCFWTRKNWHPKN